MKARRLNFIIGGIAIVVIISLIVMGIDYYVKKTKKLEEEDAAFKASIIEQLGITTGSINNIIENRQRQRDIREDTAGKEARQKYKETGEKTVVTDTSDKTYQEGGGPSVDEFDNQDATSEWDI